jgi:hypothetical protein
LKINIFYFKNKIYPVINCNSETQSFKPFQAAKKRKEKKRKKDGLFLAKLSSPLINYFYMLSAFQTFYLPCTAGLTT